MLWALRWHRSRVCFQHQELPELLRDPGRGAGCHRGGPEEGLPPAGPQVPPRQEPRAGRHGGLQSCSLSKRKEEDEPGGLACAVNRCTAIGNAFAVLSNPEKRLRYDEYGSDREHVSTGQARHYNYYTEFEADITPEEIFNVFFGGHFPTGNIHMFSNVARDAHYYPRRHRNERAWTQEQEEEENRPQNSYSAFIQLMPVFIIIIVSVITQLMATNPPYSLFYKSSIGHVVSRETENLQVPYYVDKNFEKNYQGAELQELERTVEKDYIDYIQTSCWKEKQQKSDLSNLAKLYRDERLKQKAESLKLEHCEKLSSLIGMHKGG